ncbi:MAG: PEP-CTERM sorting domain-containing protein [Deltaproteobacteria bacterium]|nr:PEP-CTERM sorting domain-containing protein [Deltaproteobacteria bacterium]
MTAGTELRWTRRLAASLLAMATSLVLWTGGAQAQQDYNMFGAFARAEGALVKLPLVGNRKGALCTALKWNQRQGTAGATTPDIPGDDFPVALTLFRQKVQGCIPGPENLTLNSLATVNVGAAGSFTIPTDFFKQLPDGLPNETLVPIPNVVAIETTMPFAGPRALQPLDANCDRVPVTPGVLPCRPIQRTLDNPTDPGNPGNRLITTPTGTAGFAAWRRFSPGAFATQSGRTDVTFTFCPGNPDCVTINQGAGGLVRYKNTKTANGFGGTMSVILSPGEDQGRFYVPQGAGGIAGPNSMLVVGVQIPPAWTRTSTGTSGGEPTRMFTTPGGGTSTLPFRGGDIGGKGYAAIQTGLGPFGGNQAYPGYVLVASTTWPGRTGFVKSVTGTPIPLPGSTNRDHQFPFTTGTVTARALFPDQEITLQMKGNDARTANGAGNIQMVAGGIRTSSTPSVTSIFVGLSLDFIPVPEPGTAGLLLAGAFGLFGLALRRKRVD